MYLLKYGELNHLCGYDLRSEIMHEHGDMSGEARDRVVDCMGGAIKKLGGATLPESMMIILFSILLHL